MCDYFTSRMYNTKSFEQQLPSTRVSILFIWISDGRFCLLFIVFPVMPLFLRTPNGVWKFLGHIKRYIVLAWKFNAFATKLWCQGPCRVYVVGVILLFNRSRFHYKYKRPAPYLIWTWEILLLKILIENNCRTIWYAIQCHLKEPWYKQLLSTWTTQQ